jgi:hypothetical protein
MMSDRHNTIIALQSSLARPSRGEGDVERACEAFHAEHAAMVAFIGGYDDAKILEFKRERSLRDAAFGEVRAHVAHTVNALLAKIRVLIVIRDWLQPDDPDLSAFAIEIATEAAAVLDTGLVTMCASETCHHRLRSTDRRTQFSEFTRPRINGRRTPFAD